MTEAECFSNYLLVMKTKCLRMFLLSATFLWGLGMHAQEVMVTIDGITYTCSGDEATVTGASSTLVEADIKSQVRAEGKDYPVTTIGSAFRSSYSLERVTIPNSIVTIKSGAFISCGKLKEITIPRSVKVIQDDAFSSSGIKVLYFNAVDCKIDQTPNYPARLDPVFSTALEEVYFGDDVLTVPGQIFYNCKNLSKVKFGKSVTTIGGNSFKFCYSLEDMNIPNTVKTIGGSAFYNCTALKNLTIGASVETINAYAFYECTSLTEVTIPSKVKNIGESVFNKCTALAKVYFNADSCETCGQFPESVVTAYIGDNVKNIPNNTFRSCKNLVDIKWGSSIEVIGSSTFVGCTSLKEIIIPSSIKEIQENAFYGCTSLESVKLSESIETLGSQVFYNCAFSEIVIPESLKSLNPSCFNKAGNLKTVYYNAKECEMAYTSSAFPKSVEQLYLGETVEVIPPSCFEGLSGLSDLKLPESLQTIGKKAFYGCTGISELTIPAKVTKIGESAFDGCSSIEKVYYAAENCKVEGRGLYVKSEELTIDKNVRSIVGSSLPYGVKVLNYNAINCDDFTARPFASTLETINIADGVQRIPANSFGSSALKEIFIPASVKEIGEFAFGKKDSWDGQCSALEKVITPSIEAWLDISFANQYSNPIYFCKSLTVGETQARKLTIPAGTEAINAYAFYNCESLLTITLPSSLKRVGNSAFTGCKALQRAIFPDVESCLSINYESYSARFENSNSCKLYINNEEFAPVDLVWPESINPIPDYVLYNNKTLKSVTIPDNITAIGEGSFYISSLNTVSIGNSVERIGKYAFYSCYLSSVTIPRSVTSIEQGAFYGCSRMYSVKFLNSILTIGKDAFNIAQRASVDIENPVNWALSSFETENSNPITYGSNFTINGEKPETLNLNLGDENLSPWAFKQVQCIKNLRVKAKSIGHNAFFNSGRITNLCLEVDSIAETAFSYCGNIKNVYSLSEDAPIAADKTFTNYADKNLYVPYGSLSNYENAATCWWQFLNVEESYFDNLNDIFGSEISTGVESVSYKRVSNDVYNLNGICVLRNATSDELKNLAPGIYIRGGKKVIVH